MRYALVSIVLLIWDAGWNVSLVYSAMTLGLSLVISSWERALLSIKTRSDLWEYPVEPGKEVLLQFTSHWWCCNPFMQNLLALAWQAAKVSVIQLKKRATCCLELSDCWLFRVLEGSTSESGWVTIGASSRGRFHRHRLFSLSQSSTDSDLLRVLYDIDWCATPGMDERGAMSDLGPTFVNYLVKLANIKLRKKPSLRECTAVSRHLLMTFPCSPMLTNLSIIVTQCPSLGGREPITLYVASTVEYFSYSPSLFHGGRTFFFWQELALTLETFSPNMVQMTWDVSLQVSGREKNRLRWWG